MISRLLPSLRARVMLGTVIVVCATALGAGGALAVAARSWVYENAQQDAFDEFRRTVEQVPDDGGRYPPDVVVVREGRVVDDPFGLADAIPSGLIDSVSAATPDLYRFVRMSDDRVAIGYQASDHPQLAFFTVQPLADVQDKLDRLTTLLALAVSGAVVVGIMFGWLVSRAVVRPLRDVEECAEAITAGDTSVRMPVTGVRELQRMTEALNAMLDGNDAVVTMLRSEEQRAKRFVSDVSHELRSPLAAIVPTTEVLSEELADDHGAAGRAARVLSAEVIGLSGLVEDLLEMTRRDAGVSVVVAEPVPVASVISDEVRRRGWEAVTVVGEGRGFTTDRRRLTAIVTNLVANALTHGARPVQVDLDFSDDCLTVTVSDHGPGVPPEHADRIFERLYKASDARTRSGGAGLGLAIARENAELLGGDVRYERVRGTTKFIVRIVESNS